VDSLSKRVKEGTDDSPRWSPLDAYILVAKYVNIFFERAIDTTVRRVDSLDVSDESEIDWQKFPDSDWNTWSPGDLKRRWRRMKQRVDGHADMTISGMALWSCRRLCATKSVSHIEIMDALRAKHPYIVKRGATSPAPSRKKPVSDAARTKSKEIVEDSDDEAETEVEPKVRKDEDVVSDEEEETEIR